MANLPKIIKKTYDNIYEPIPDTVHDIWFDKFPLGGPVQNFPKLTNIKNIYVIDCDKNFVYYHINKTYFPNVEKIYLASHPCESDVLQQENVKIYLVNWYQTYYDRWAKKDNVELIDNKEILTLLHSYQVI